MFQEIPVNIPKVFAFKAIGKLSHKDYQRFLPRLEEILAQEGKISLLIELENFSGWQDWQAVKDDYQFGMKYRDQFERIALVGDQAWEKMIALLSRPFVKGEVRFFEHNQMDQAWDWLTAKPKAFRLPEQWQHILVPLDFAWDNRILIHRAQQLAHCSDARLSLLHVLPEPMYYTDEGLWLDMETEQKLLREAEQALAKISQSFEGLQVQQQVLLGEAATSIIHYVRGQEVDLIVLGLHHRRGLEKLLGSTSQVVFKAVNCEILTVPLNEKI